MNVMSDQPPALNSQSLAAIHQHLRVLYGDEAGAQVFAQLQARLGAFVAQHPRGKTPAGLTERDAILITYGDQLSEPGQPPLQTLAEFCEAHLRGVVSGVHILPFYPYTSDDGFSVVDYREVNPALGGWGDVARIGRSFRMMFDAVVNHVSASSAYFRGFLRDDPRYKNFAVTVSDPADPRLAQVTRPRALPLLTDFETPSGVKHVWTTFSADQIDLNFKNPDVLLEILDVLLFYVERGAQFIRLDAIAFLWKELGTTCLNLPQTHHAVQLMRAALDEAAPGTMLITETNVPHRENLSYFGDGRNEAHMVYNFALPPLTTHTFRTGNAKALTAWANTLAAPSNQTTFFNFLASHDGIGLNPARGILSGEEIDALAEGTLARGGFIGYKNMPDGSRSPYEMNINFVDAIAPLDDGRQTMDDGNASSPSSIVHRLSSMTVAAHAIMLSLIGVPGIYWHSLFGSRGWPQGVAALGHNRAVNRQKFSRAQVEGELADPNSLRAKVFAGLRALLRVRAAHPAFHPHGAQRVLDLDPGVFALTRTAPGVDMRDPAQVFRNTVVCIINVTNEFQFVAVDWRNILGTRNNIQNLMNGSRINIHGPSLMVQPYQVLWVGI